MKRRPYSASELLDHIASGKQLVANLYAEGSIPLMRPSVILDLITKNGLVSRNGNEGHISSLTLTKEMGSVVVAIGIAPPNHPRPRLRYTPTDHARYERRKARGWTHNEIVKFTSERDQWLTEFKRVISETEDGWRVVKIEQPLRVPRAWCYPTRSANTVIWATRVPRKPWSAIRALADAAASTLVMHGDGY